MPTTRSKAKADNSNGQKRKAPAGDENENIKKPKRTAIDHEILGEKLENEPIQEKDTIQIFVKRLNGKTFTLDVNASDTINKSLTNKLRMSNKQGRPAKNSNVGRKRKAPLCEENVTSNFPENQLKNENMQKEFKFYLDLCLEAGMQIILEDNGGKTITLDIQSSDLKFKIRGDDKDEIQSNVKTSEKKLDDESQKMRVFVEKLNGEKTALEVTASSTINEIKTMIQEKEGVPPDQQKLSFAGKRLEDEKTLTDYKINMEPSICFRELREIFVEDPKGKVIALECEASDTIRKIKEKIDHQERISPYQQKLIINGNQLENEKSLSDYNIQHKAMIKLERRIGMEIYVKMPDGKRLAFDVGHCDKPDAIKNLIEKKEGILKDRQRLLFAGASEDSHYLESNIDLDEQNVGYESTITLEVRPIGSIEVFITNLLGFTFALDVFSSDTIANVKKNIQTKKECPASLQRLNLRDIGDLDDERTVSDYNIREYSTISLIMKLPR